MGEGNQQRAVDDIEEVETTVYDERDNDRAVIFRKPEEAEVQPVEGTRVYLHEGGKAYPMVISETKRDKRTKKMLYVLAEPNGTLYKGGEYFRQDVVKPR